MARPRLEFRGQRLEITLDPDRVRSDSPVELRRGLYRTDAHYYRNELS